MMEALINPWFVSGALGLVLGMGMLVVLWRSAAATQKWLKELREKLLTRTAFFWAVNITFMAVSVLHAGVFFGITGSAHSVEGTAQYLGFAVSFFLDLVTIILMQAMLEARHRGEDDRARQFLLFISICCATSTFANLAISLNDFNAALVLPHAPGWVQVASPYVLSSFPLFVIMMSIASEMILNIRPMDMLNETTFEADEKKRIKMLEIRNHYLAKQVQAELEMQIIRAKRRANKALRKGQLPGSFRWFWEKPLEVDFVVAGVSQQLEGMYETKFSDLSQQNEQLFQVVEALKLAANTGALPGSKPVKAVSVKLSHVATSPAGKMVDPVTEKTLMVEPLNGAKVEQHNGGTSGVSRARITNVLSESDDDGVLSSINGIAASLDLASLNLAPDVLAVVKRCPGVYTKWLSQSVKSVTIPEIIDVTGQSKRRIVYQVGKALKQTSRNENKILVSSVIEWLGSMPLPEQIAVHSINQNDYDNGTSSDQNSENVAQHNGETVDETYLHLLGNTSDDETDKLAITLAAMREKPGITDEELAEKLGMLRPASARFWRLKAQMLLEQGQELVEQSLEYAPV